MSDSIKNQVDSHKNKTAKYDQLVSDIHNNITTRLTDLMSKLLNSAQDKLFDMSEASDNNEDQTHYFELMNQIRDLKPEIAVTFDEKVKAILIPAKDHKTQQTQDKDDDGELSLIDQDEMESIVLVKGIGERASSRYREKLQHLDARFEHLALKTPVVFKSDALLPTNFCQAFDDALGDNFSNTNKKLLFSMFDAEIASKLDTLYDSINNRLIDAEILPQIKLHKYKKSPSRARLDPQQGQAENADGAQQHDDAAVDHGDSIQTGGAGAGTSGQNISGFAMTAAPGGNYRNASQNQSLSPGNSQVNTNAADSDTGSNNTNYQQQSVGMPSSQSNGQVHSHASDDSQADSNTDDKHYTAGMPASQVGRVLSNFIGAPFSPGSANTPATDNAAFYPESTPESFGHQEIIHALSSIQQQIQFEQSDGTPLSGEAIRQAVLLTIAKTTGGGAVTKSINQIAEKTIDFIELIFDAIVEDKELSDTIKTLLLRLQIPIIKASMADREFFIYDDHPARTLLDTIADAGVGVSEHTDEIYKFLDKLITNILAEYELNTETFQLALDKLNAYIDGKNAITSAKEEEEQQQLLRKHARATILKSLRAATTGKILPEEVHALILKRWPTLMFNHYLSNGKENDEWINIILTLRHIVDSVQTVTSAEQLAKILAEKDALFEQTEKYLNVSSNSKKDVQNVMSVYKDVVQKHIDDANFTEGEVTVAEKVISEAEPVAEAPIEEINHDKQAIPPDIMPGMWFQVSMGDDHAVRRCKLSVILVEDANLMFVNHKGELVAEKSFDEFNSEIANETTKVIMGHSAFESAFKTVINRLN